MTAISATATGRRALRARRVPANRKQNETVCGQITSYLMVRCGYNDSTYDNT
jgi:hypothetical protein